MPTGYTAPVQDGTVTDFSDFALLCARGFGAMMLLRDHDQGLEATRKYIASGAYLEESSYHDDRVAAAQAELVDLRAMSDDDALAAANKEHAAATKRNEEHNARNQTENDRYEAMLAQAEAWEPPTEEHVGFKEFMVKQLKESIDFDCGSYDRPIPEITSGAVWRQEQIAKAEKEIAYHLREVEKERERNEQRRAWVVSLLDSLEAVTA